MTDDSPDDSRRVATRRRFTLTPLLHQNWDRFRKPIIIVSLVVFFVVYSLHLSPWAAGLLAGGLMLAVTLSIEAALRWRRRESSGDL